jgi:D-glycero-beta-D-manno-heptose 1-phosphate adenylyltransferase
VGQAQATLLKHILFAFMGWGLRESRGIKEMLAYQPLERFKGCLAPRLWPASIATMNAVTPSPSASPAFFSKLCDRANLKAQLRQLPRPWVFTNGVFDVLHRGHVTYLAHARELGASLIVALNTDASVKRLGKGDDRPLNNDADRAVLMASQQAVDLVTWFGEDTPLQIIGEIRPDILVKGGDYDMDTLAEAALVRSWGGRAMALPFVAGYSTTQMLAKIRAS